MVLLNQMFKEFDLECRSVDREDIWASRIAEEIKKQFVVETQESVSTQELA